MSIRVDGRYIVIIIIDLIRQFYDARIFSIVYIHPLIEITFSFAKNSIFLFGTKEILIELQIYSRMTYALCERKTNNVIINRSGEKKINDRMLVSHSLIVHIL